MPPLMYSRQKEQGSCRCTTMKSSRMPCIQARWGNQMLLVAGCTGEGSRGWPRAAGKGAIVAVRRSWAASPSRLEASSVLSPPMQFTPFPKFPGRCATAAVQPQLCTSNSPATDLDRVSQPPEGLLSGAAAGGPCPLAFQRLAAGGAGGRGGERQVVAGQTYSTSGCRFALERLAAGEALACQRRQVRASTRNQRAHHMATWPHAPWPFLATTPASAPQRQHRAPAAAAALDRRRGALAALAALAGDGGQQVLCFARPVVACT